MYLLKIIFEKIIKNKNNSTTLVVISFIAFISLGMPDGLLGVAWPSIRKDFLLPVDALGPVLIFGTAGYMMSSFFSGALVRKLGVGGLLSFSCALTSGTLLVYAVTPFWWLFVFVATFGGLGAGAIDAGINTYVAKNHSPRMMQWLHASFGIGTTMGPVIMTLGIALTQNWKTGYFVVFAAQGILAVIFFFTKNIWKKDDVNLDDDSIAVKDASLWDTLKVFSAILSMVMFFIYTGVELGIGLWIYTLLTESRHFNSDIAGIVTAGYWGMFTLGRVCAGWFGDKLRTDKLIYLCIIFAFIGVLLIFINLTNYISVVGILIAGFSIAPIFPGLVSDTESRVGTVHEANTIGMQISAAGFGAALVPSVAGVFAKIYGLESIPVYILVITIILFFCFMLSHKK